VYEACTGLDVYRGVRGVYRFPLEFELEVRIGIRRFLGREFQILQWTAELRLLKCLKCVWAPLQ
jgi:hypothetical protein